MFPGLNIDPVSLVRWSIRSTFRSLIIHTLFFPFLDSFNKGYFKYQNTSYIYIYIFIVRVELKDKRVKCKIRVACLNFFVNYIFVPYIFCYKVTSPLYF
jgi:hypothetical protein